MAKTNKSKPEEPQAQAEKPTPQAHKEPGTPAFNKKAPFISVVSNETTVYKQNGNVFDINGKFLRAEA